MKHPILYIATLNTWLVYKYSNKCCSAVSYLSYKFRLLPHPWPIGSKNKTFRIQKLIESIYKSPFDIIALQEVYIYFEIKKS
jgi:hypothetical protein